MLSTTLDAPKSKPPAKTRRDSRKERQAARERFRRAHLAERAFARKLKLIANAVGSIVKKFAPHGRIPTSAGLTKALTQYSKAIGPWAQKAAQSLVTEVARRDAQAWGEMGVEIGRALRQEIKNAPTGKAMRAKMAEQVVLIQSLPTKAAERVHKLTIEGLAGGQRASVVAKEIMRTGHVTAARARLIARTETTRTATAMVEARSRFIGSEGYIWRTAEDTDVRHDHKRLEGKFIPWTKPPIAGPNGMRYHAGAGPNCRCYPEPLIPDRFD